MQGCTEFEKGTANRKKNYNCFFIFSSCNWTCMYLTLQWPGSFCLVCLYILYITVLVNFTQDSIAVCLKSYESTDIDIIASFKTSRDLCLSCYFCLTFSLNSSFFLSSHRVSTTKPFVKYHRLFKTGPSMAYGEEFNGCCSHSRSSENEHFTGTFCIFDWSFFYYF